MSPSPETRRSSRRAAAIVALPLVLLVAPVGAQSPSLPAASVAPVAASARPAMDASSAAGQLLALRETLQTDRLLLAELRKDVPTTREAGEAFVGRVVDLALTSDPVRLGVIASRVREAAPAWLEWRGRQFASAQEASDAYAQMGAAAFDASWEKLHDAVLLTVIDRLDTIIDLTDRIEDGQ